MHKASDRGEPRTGRPASSVSTDWAGLSLLALATVLALAAFSTANGTLLLMALTAGATHLARRWFPTDVAVILAVAALVLTATAIGLLSWGMGWHLLGARPQALGAMAVVVGAFAMGYRVPGGRQLASLPRSGWTWTAFIPAFALVPAAVANVFCSRVAISWVALIKDTAEHAWLVSELRRTGQLDYSSGLYPRGLHSLAAWSYTAVGQPNDMLTQLQAVAGLVFLCYALTVAALTSLSMRLCIRGGARMQGMVGLTTGVLLLGLNAFVGQFVQSSAHASLLALTFSLVPVFLSQATSALRQRLVLCAIPLVAALQANLWTATLAASAGVGAIAICRSFVVGRLDGWRRTVRDLLVATPVTLLAAPMVGVVLLALERHGGTGIASLPGHPFTPGPYAYVFPMVGFVALAYRCRRLDRMVMLSTILGFVAMTGVLLVASGKPTDLGQWYPTKGVWFALMAAMPAGVAGGTAGIIWICRRVSQLTASFGERRRLVNLVTASVALTALGLANGVAIWSYTLQPPRLTIPFRSTPSMDAQRSEPSGVDALSAGQVSQRRVEIALGYGGRYAPRVTMPVLVGSDNAVDKSADSVVSTLMRLRTGQALNAGGLTNLCKQVAMAGGREPVTVITAAPRHVVTDALKQQGCMSIPVQELPWPAAYYNTATP